VTRISLTGSVGNSGEWQRHAFAASGHKVPAGTKQEKKVPVRARLRPLRPQPHRRSITTIMCGQGPGVFVIPIIRTSFAALTTTAIEPSFVRNME
jgi:hypothetical protein